MHLDTVFSQVDKDKFAIHKGCYEKLKIYRITKDTEAPYETNRYVLVFTKDERPIVSNRSSRAEIEQWMALIPNNMKYIYVKGFDIRKR
jgi:arginine deiminase